MLGSDWILKPGVKLRWESLIHNLPAFVYSGRLYKGASSRYFSVQNLWIFFLFMFKLKNKQCSTMFWAPFRMLNMKSWGIEGSWVGEGWPQYVSRISLGFGCFIWVNIVYIFCWNSPIVFFIHLQDCLLFLLFLYAWK